MNNLRKILGNYYFQIAIFCFKYIRPISSRKFDTSEECLSCGAVCRMYFNPWVINRRTLSTWGNAITSFEYLLRESRFCRVCGAPYRVRRISEILMLNLCKKKHTYLNQCILSGELNNYSILQLNEIGGAGSLQETLGKLPNVVTTIYDPRYGFGDLIDGKSNQDMTNLTFETNSFDIVLHSEVLEHVVDFKQAHSEAVRVLKPNGKLIFTIPVQLHNKETFSRIQLDASRNVLFVLPKIWHGWAGGPFALLPRRDDYLEMHTFGEDIFRVLDSKLGNLEIHKSSSHFTSGADWVFTFAKL